MASISQSSAEEQWRQQLAAMKDAVAMLKLPATSNVSDLDDYDDSDGSDDYYSSASGGAGQDIWDFISDSELEELGLAPSDDGDFPPSSTGAGASSTRGTFSAYGPSWLSTRCLALASRSSQTSAPIPPDVLRVQIMDVLQSSRPEEELQSQLTDLVGFDDLDFIIELLSHRDEIVSAAFVEDAAPASHTVDGASSSSATAMVGSTRLLTKAQREEQLRQKDFQHKTAVLAAASAKEADYPHVYKAYNAGNSLSVTGKRYALPEGSTAREREKYTEYYIPAGSKGTLGPGQKLVEISDLDGLCRRTFKGYTALNRMQSLVYPVAYKTSENLLICAPTGAVSFSHIVV